MGAVSRRARPRPDALRGRPGQGPGNDPGRDQGELVEVRDGGRGPAGVGAGNGLALRTEPAPRPGADSRKTGSASTGAVRFDAGAHDRTAGERGCRRSHKLSRPGPAGESAGGCGQLRAAPNRTRGRPQDPGSRPASSCTPATPRLGSGDLARLSSRGRS